MPPARNEHNRPPPIDHLHARAAQDHDTLTARTAYAGLTHTTSRRHPPAAASRTRTPLSQLGAPGPGCPSHDRPRDGRPFPLPRPDPTKAKTWTVLATSPQAAWYPGTPYPSRTARALVPIADGLLTRARAILTGVPRQPAA